jgi:hypothetical protein
MLRESSQIRRKPMSATCLFLKGGALVLVLALAILASFPAPLRAVCLWGVTYTYYYSTGGACYYDCYNQETCWGDTSGDIIDVGQGEYYYCY